MVILFTHNILPEETGKSDFLKVGKQNYGSRVDGRPWCSLKIILNTYIYNFCCKTHYKG